MLDLGTLRINIQADTAKANKEIGKLEKETKSAEKEVDKSTEGIGESFDALGTKVALGVGAAVTAIGALVEKASQTQEDMGKLNTAFDQAGYSAETANSVFSDMVGLLGETDQAVEASNHLAQLATSEQDLATWADIAAGVYATFGDSLPLESLTEAANETAKVGTLTGGLADALNWVGISEDEFNQKLAACADETERSRLITEALTDAYQSAGQEYQNTNADVIAYRQAQADLNQTLSELGMKFMPIVTEALESFSSIAESCFLPLADVIADVLGWFADLDDGTQKLIVTIAALAAAARPIGSLFDTFKGSIGTVVTGFKNFNATVKAGTPIVSAFGKATSLMGGAIGVILAVIGVIASLAMDYFDHMEKMETATTDLVETAEAAPAKLQATADSMGEMGEGAEDAAAKIDGLTRSSEEALEAQVELSNNIKERWSDIQSTADNVSYYVGVIEELGNKGNLSATEQLQLKTAVEEVNKACGTSIEITDSLNGTLSESVESIKASTQAWLDNAKAQAAQESMVDIQKELIPAQQELAEAQQKLNDLNAEFEANPSAWQAYTWQISEAEKEVDECQQRVDSLNESNDLYMKTLESTASAIASVIPQNQAFNDVLSSLGMSVQTAATNLQSFGLTATEVQQLSSEQFSWLAQNAGASVDTIAAKFSEMNWVVPASMQSMLTNAGYAIDENGYIVTNAASNVADTAESEFNKDAEAQADGASMSNSYGSGIASGESVVKTESTKIGDAAESGINSNDGEGWGWGNDLGNAFASGISDAWGAVTSAASSIASAVKGILGHSVPKEGILHNHGKGEKPWGEHLVKNIAEGMLAGQDDVIKAANQIAEDIAEPLSNLQATVGIRSNGYNPLENYEAYRRMYMPANKASKASLGNTTYNQYYIGDTAVTTMTEQQFAEDFVALMTRYGRLAAT